MQTSSQSEPSIRRTNLESDLTCIRVLQPEQIERALRITYASYCQRGLILPNRSELWMTQYHLLAQSRVLLANRGEQAKGTLTLVEDGPKGLPMDMLFSREVDRCRQAHRRIAEATCLALDERGSLAGLEIVNLLMGAVAQAAYFAGIEMILITVHPRHAKYYTRMAGFSVIGQALPYPAVRGHLAIPLALNLMTLRKTNPASHQRYFGMHLSHDTVTPTPTPYRTIQHLSKLWDLVRSESQSEILEAFPARNENIELRRAM